MIFIQKLLEHAKPPLNPDIFTNMSHLNNPYWFLISYMKMQQLLTGL